MGQLMHKDIEELLRKHKLRSKWDAIVLSDGSGSKYPYAIGYASTLITRTPEESREFYGGMSQGTVNVAELLAVWQPLLWLENQNVAVQTPGYRVVIFSDSEYTVQLINSMQPGRVVHPSRNASIAKAIHQIVRQGIYLNAIHVERNTIVLQEEADTMSKVARKIFKQLKLEKGENKDGTKGSSEQTAEGETKQ